MRHREQFANPPVSLGSDEAAIEWLTALISAWALAELAQAQPDGLEDRMVGSDLMSQPATAAVKNANRRTRLE